MPHALVQIFTHAHLPDFKNRNSWAGHGQCARRSSRHVLSELGPILAASAVASCGWNYWQRRLESCSSSLSLQRGWSARMATRWSSHRPACSIRYRSPRVSSSADDSFKTFAGGRPLASPSPFTLFARQTEPQVAVLFGKRWEFGDNREVWKAFVCRYAPPRSCCSWGTSEAKRCIPARRRLHWMASDVIHGDPAADQIVRGPSGGCRGDLISMPDSGYYRVFYKSFLWGNVHFGGCFERPSLQALFWCKSFVPGK